MAPRTVLMLTNNYFPNQGGVAQSVDASTQALMALGYHVVIVTLDIAGADNDPDYVKRVPSIVRMKLKKNRIAVPWRLDAYVDKIVEMLNPDIIHTHHPWLLGHAAIKAARARHCPVIFTHHTLYHAYTHYVPLPHTVTSFFITQRVRTYCALVDHIIAPSQAVADSLARHANTAEIAIIASPIRSCFVSHEKQVSDPTQPLKLLYVGRFVKEKNMHAMLDAVRLLPQQSYVLDCVGYGPLWHELHTYAYETLRLPAHQVRFHHKPDQADLVRWYQQADLFLFPSFTDTQGLVLAEAMACGTPVIALDGPGQRSIITNGQNGYIVSTPAQMAATIAFVANHRQLLQQMSCAAAITARDYTIEKHGQRLAALYEAVIEQKKRGSSRT